MDPQTCFEFATGLVWWVFGPFTVITTVYIKWTRALPWRDTLLIMTGLKRVFYTIPELLLIASTIGLSLGWFAFNLEQCKTASMVQAEDLRSLAISIE